jgi:hypothetical protein
MQQPLLGPCRYGLFQAHTATRREIHVVTPWRVLMSTFLLVGPTAPAIIHRSTQTALLLLVGYVYAKPNFLIKMMKGYFLQ